MKNLQRFPILLLITTTLFASSFSQTASWKKPLPSKLYVSNNDKLAFNLANNLDLNNLKTVTQTDCPGFVYQPSLTPASFSHTMLGEGVCQAPLQVSDSLFVRICDNTGFEARVLSSTSSKKLSVVKTDLNTLVSGTIQGGLKKCNKLLKANGADPIYFAICEPGTTESEVTNIVVVSFKVRYVTVHGGSGTGSGEEPGKPKGAILMGVEKIIQSTKNEIGSGFEVDAVVLSKEGEDAATLMLFPKDLAGSGFKAWDVKFNSKTGKIAGYNFKNTSSVANYPTLTGKNKLVSIKSDGEKLVFLFFSNVNSEKHTASHSALKASFDTKNYSVSEKGPELIAESDDAQVMFTVTTEIESKVTHISVFNKNMFVSGVFLDSSTFSSFLPLFSHKLTTPALWTVPTQAYRYGKLVFLVGSKDSVESVTQIWLEQNTSHNLETGKESSGFFYMRRSASSETSKELMFFHNHKNQESDPVYSLDLAVVKRNMVFLTLAPKLEAGLQAKQKFNCKITAEYKNGNKLDTAVEIKVLLDHDGDRFLTLETEIAAYSESKFDFPIFASSFGGNNADFYVTQKTSEEGATEKIKIGVHWAEKI